MTRKHSRRQFLRTGLAGIAIGVAGCLGSDEGEPAEGTFPDPDITSTVPDTSPQKTSELNSETQKSTNIASEIGVSIDEKKTIADGWPSQTISLSIMQASNQYGEETSQEIYWEYDAQSVDEIDSPLARLNPKSFVWPTEDRPLDIGVVGFQTKYAAKTSFKILENQQDDPVTKRSISNHGEWIFYPVNNYYYGLSQIGNAIFYGMIKTEDYDSPVKSMVNQIKRGGGTDLYGEKAFPTATVRSAAQHKDASYEVITFDLNKNNILSLSEKEAKKDEVASLLKEYIGGGKHQQESIQDALQKTTGLPDVRGNEADVPVDTHITYTIWWRDMNGKVGKTHPGGLDSQLGVHSFKSPAAATEAIPKLIEGYWRALDQIDPIYGLLGITEYDGWYNIRTSHRTYFASGNVIITA